jgi:uncharacterized protein
MSALVSSVAVHIAVFCRPMIAGAVKTRLIPTFGAPGAARIYAQLVDRTLRTVAATRNALRTNDAIDASASLWVAGDCAHESVQQWSREFAMPVHTQVDGDLGEKMFDCLARMNTTCDRVLLIGTDCPAFTVDHLSNAASALTASADWVFTPAEDGGYVLVGTRAPRREPFATIEWSTASVMRQTRDALRHVNASFVEMPKLWDVDEPADVLRALEAGLIT